MGLRADKGSRYQMTRKPMWLQPGPYPASLSPRSFWSMVKLQNRILVYHCPYEPGEMGGAVWIASGDGGAGPGITGAFRSRRVIKVSAQGQVQPLPQSTDLCGLAQDYLDLSAKSFGDGAQPERPGRLLNTTLPTFSLPRLTIAYSTHSLPSSTLATVAQRSPSVA